MINLKIVHKSKLEECFIVNGQTVYPETFSKELYKNIDTLEELMESIVNKLGTFNVHKVVKEIISTVDESDTELAKITIMCGVIAGHHVRQYKNDIRCILEAKPDHMITQILEGYQYGLLIKGYQLAIESNIEVEEIPSFCNAVTLFTFGVMLYVLGEKERELLLKDLTKFTLN